MAKEEKKVTAEEATKVLEQEKAEKINKCTAEIREILNKYECAIAASFTLTEKGNYPQIQIINK